MVSADGVSRGSLENTHFRFFLTLLKEPLGLLGDLGLFGENGLSEPAADAGGVPCFPAVLFDGKNKGMEQNGLSAVLMCSKKHILKKTIL